MRGLSLRECYTAEDYEHSGVGKVLDLLTDTVERYHTGYGGSKGEQMLNELMGALGETLELNQQMRRGVLKTRRKSYYTLRSICKSMHSAGSFVTGRVGNPYSLDESLDHADSGDTSATLGDMISGHDAAERSMASVAVEKAAGACQTDDVFSEGFVSTVRLMYDSIVNPDKYLVDTVRVIELQAFLEGGVNLRYTLWMFLNASSLGYDIKPYEKSLVNIFTRGSDASAGWFLSFFKYFCDVAHISLPRGAFLTPTKREIEQRAKAPVKVQKHGHKSCVSATSGLKFKSVTEMKAKDLLGFDTQLTGDLSMRTELDDIADIADLYAVTDTFDDGGAVSAPVQDTKFSVSNIDDLFCDSYVKGLQTSHKRKS